MTVQTTQTYVEYAGDASTLTFTLPFKFIEIGHLVASRTLTATPGTPEILTIESVTGASLDAGWSATLTAPVGSGYTLKIQRVTARLQLRPYPANDPFPSRAHEGGLDRLTMIVQELAETVGIVIPPVIGVPGNGVLQVIGGATTTADLSGAGGIVVAATDGTLTVPSASDVTEILAPAMRQKIPSTIESFPATQINWITDSDSEIFRADGCFCWIVPAYNLDRIKWFKTVSGHNTTVPVGKVSIWGGVALDFVDAVKLSEFNLPDVDGIRTQALDLDASLYRWIGVACDPGLMDPGVPIAQTGGLVLTDAPVTMSPKYFGYVGQHTHNAEFTEFPSIYAVDSKYLMTRWMELGVVYKDGES